VAIKVLPAAFPAAPERPARFEREAQLLGQLHHSNIAHIYAFEDHGNRVAVSAGAGRGTVLHSGLATAS
jgi:serine/threonine protein kinase